MSCKGECVSFVGLVAGSSPPPAGLQLPGPTASMRLFREGVSVS